ncbi:MAG: hypothetical protein LWY06_06570 [Firmicutes bacterium]|nr:hypothetical protein [Bacillota bacterium]
MSNFRYIPDEDGINGVIEELDDEFDEERWYCIPYGPCTIAGNILTILRMAKFYFVDGFVSWDCGRREKCKTEKRDCWLSGGSDTPFDNDEMREYMLKNAEVMKHGERDFSDLMYEYMIENPVNEKNAISAMQELTGKKYNTKEEWIAWKRGVLRKHKK